MPRADAIPFNACAIRSAWASLSMTSGPAIRRSGAPEPATTPSAMRIRGDGILVLEGDDAAARLLVAIGRGDEFSEEGVGRERPRLVLRVELTGEKPRVLRVLDDLDEASIGGKPRHAQPGLVELRQELLVHLVPVAMPVDRHIRAVGLARETPRREVCGVGAEPHR